jgi:hypothetical protein
MNRTVLMTALLLIAQAPGLIAREVIIDLATQDPGSTEQRAVNADEDLTVKIINRVPNKTYNITIEQRSIVVPPLQLPADAAPAESTCANLVGNFLVELNTKTDEDAVAGLISEFRQKAAPCSKSIQQEFEDAVDAHTVRLIPDTYRLDQGEELVVTITRNPTWITIFSTGPRGEWRTSYGFNFIPDKDEIYFSKEAGEGEFEITRKGDGEDFDFAPSVFFTWLSRKQQQRDLAFGPVAGLGFDSDNPIVFGGITFSYNQNIQLNLGAVVHQQKRLNGTFEPNQIIAENLGSEELESTTYGINWFFGLSFRLDSNPFAGSEDDNEE